MKYTRGAEAISIFRPTDTPLTSFCPGCSGETDAERQVIFSSCSSLYVWHCSEGKGVWADDVSNTAIHDSCKLNSAHMSVSLSKPLQHITNSVSYRSRNINDSSARWLWGAHRAPWALQERLFVPAGSKAPSVGTSHGSYRYCHLQQGV